jgi:hypothetical protein
VRILAKNLDLDLRFGAPAIAAAAKALWKLATNDLEVQVCPYPFHRLSVSLSCGANPLAQSRLG